MTIFLVHPGTEGFQAGIPFEVFRHGDAPLVPWSPEIFVLEGIVEADRTRVLQTGGEIDVVNARPVDGAHTHRAGRAVDVDLAPLQHTGALRHRIGRAGLARN